MLLLTFKVLRRGTLYAITGKWSCRLLSAYSICVTTAHAPVQFAVGGVLALTMWTLNLHSKPKVDKDLVRLSIAIASYLVSLHWSMVSSLHCYLLQGVTGLVLSPKHKGACGKERVSKAT